ncbi:unnamed protein product [Closterium sp. Naga37s-1]|nr:unnamed protein product [Closterium sp. Naga37s-1]
MALRTRRDQLFPSPLIPPSVSRSQPYFLPNRRHRRRRHLRHRASHAFGSILPPAAPLPRATLLPRATPLPRAIPLSLPRCLRAPFASFRHALAAILPLVLLSSILLSEDTSCHVARAESLDVLTPKGGCLTSRCVRYTRGRWLLPSGKASAIINANGNLNYERYKLTDSTDVILKTNVINVNTCCQKCAQADECVFFHYEPPLVPGNGVCRLLTSLDKFTVDNTKTSVDPSYIGGKCNPLAEVKNDPHFVGAEGTRFDFHGELNRSFCLLTDRDLHINMGIKGELYMTWRDPIGRQHSVFLKARDGKEQTQGERGLIERMVVDGRPLTPPTQVGQAVHGEGTFHMVLAAAGPMGDGRDRDTYRVRVAGVASIELSLHAAHPLLQTAEEAYTHFNVYFKYLNNTNAVHGVLGQTFRGEVTRAKRAEEYGLLTGLLRAPIQADGETGRGFLDGNVEDYATSAIDAADCAFATAWNEARKKVREVPGEEQGAYGVAEKEARGEVEEAREESEEPRHSAPLAPSPLAAPLGPVGPVDPVAPSRAPSASLAPSPLAAPQGPVDPVAPSRATRPRWPRRP